VFLFCEPPPCLVLLSSSHFDIHQPLRFFSTPTHRVLSSFGFALPLPLMTRFGDGPVLRLPLRFSSKSCHLLRQAGDPTLISWKPASFIGCPGSSFNLPFPQFFFRQLGSAPPVTFRIPSPLGSGDCAGNAVCQSNPPSVTMVERGGGTIKNGTLGFGQIVLFAGDPFSFFSTLQSRFQHNGSRLGFLLIFNRWSPIGLP